MRRLLVLLICIGAVTPVSALTIDTDTIWRGDLHFAEPVRVESGVTLTVTAGTRVTFSGGRLEVAGRLVSENASFGGSSWEGIVLKGCDERTVLAGGSVSGAKIGIFSGGGAPQLRGIMVQGNEVGIELKQQSAAMIRDCRIVGNRKVGLFIKDEATPVITGNLFEKNGKFGAYIYRALPSEFSGNRFTRNETGLMIANAGSDPLIERNRFESNQTAILVDRAARPQLRGNLLRGNEVAVRLYRRADARVEGNRFERNGDGISLAYSSYPTITGNDFIANRRPLTLEFQSSAWEREKGEATRASEASSRSAFGPAAGHAEAAGERRKVQGLTGQVDARDNWWGEEGTRELAGLGASGNPSFIHDGRDAPTFEEGGRTWPLDRVTFSPWRSLPVATWKDN